MAKKTTSRTKPESQPESSAGAAPLAKPAARPRAPKRADKNVPDQGPEAPSVSMASEPSEEDIRVRAYHRYLERGGGHGMDFEDWLEAKRELVHKK
jgi:hypothetical protein